MRLPAVLCAILVLACAGVAAAAPPDESGRKPASLRMEDLEVRGRMEKTGTLYLPVHKGIDPPSPVRYDLFLEDMAGPFPPRPSRSSP